MRLAFFSNFYQQITVILILPFMLTVIGCEDKGIMSTELKFWNQQECESTNFIINQSTFLFITQPSSITQEIIIPNTANQLSFPNNVTELQLAPTTSIYGLIRDPLPDLTVVLECSGALYTAEVNALTGWFIVTNIPPGSYWLRIIHTTPIPTTFITSFTKNNFALFNRNCALI